MHRVNKITDLDIYANLRHNSNSTQTHYLQNQEIPIYIKKQRYLILNKFPRQSINNKLISSMNFSLDSVIEVLLCSDNQRRMAAEQFINELPNKQFSEGIDAFLMSMNHQNEQVAAMGALLLKKKYLDDKANRNMISSQKMVMIVQTVKICMTENRPLLFLKRCCQILVKIFSYANQKQELVGIVMQMVHSTAVNMKMAMLYLIEIACEFSFDDTMLIQYSASFEAIFSSGLEDQSKDVKVASFKTLTTFLSSITDEKIMGKFKDVLKILLDKSIELIKMDQQSGINALQSLNELVEAHPKFIKPIFQNLLMIYTEIMEAKLLINLRITAMSGILTLCMKHHTLVRKSNYFKNTMVKTYMMLLAEINADNISQWAEELVDEVISKNDISMSTEEHLAQIANQLGNKFMLPLFIPYIQQCLSSPMANYQHAGLTALAILIENCHQNYKAELKNMITLMLPLLQSDHPRIIYDILIAMGYMATEFAPQIQINFGDLILGFIIKALNHNIMKIQYKAVLCIVNFEQGLIDHQDVKIMENYIDKLLGDMSLIFENSVLKSNFIMLEAVLESIGSIASLNPFGKYYNTFMPGLKKIINMVTNDTPQKISIRSKTIEAMGDLLISIKQEPFFSQECSNIMQSLINLQNQIDKEDILHRAIFTVYENVVEVMGPNFSIYSDFVFKVAHDAVMRKADLQVIDQTESQKVNKNPNMHTYVKLKVDLKIDGVKNIVLNTDTFEQKIEASNLLFSMAEFMGPKFISYAEHMITIIKELIFYKSSKQVRTNMINITKHMIVGAENMELKRMMLNALFPILAESLSATIKCKDHIECSNVVDAISQIMPYMIPQMSMKLPDMMMAVLAFTRDMVSEIEKIYAEKQKDDDLNEQMSSEIEQVEEVLQYIEQIMIKGKGVPAFDKLRTMFPKEYEFEA